ncbi:ACT domain-containing protein ACR8-like [Canna indica]|uniref:ACT domain-containing protein ACR n=1 Tax=Canna indica TaxID=4628 RepID=A0AAQ3QHP0_9LILI|nr:ACT domain-containing protein ACR8-like [Canna indica]
MAWRAYLNEYEKLVIRMDTPRVVIDNAVCPTATLVKVDSARKHAILLEAVQVLTDLNLSVKKAYISSDGRWFMDVFHVTDQFGRKLTDDSVISYLEQSLGTEEDDLDQPSKEDGGLTTLELTGGDRPGLLSEVFAVLADLGCSVVEAKVWTHSGRIACLVSVKDELSGLPVDCDTQRIHHILSRLRHILKDDHGVCDVRTAVSSMALAHTDRRLHQMMFSDRDYERSSISPLSSAAPSVSVQNWAEREYSIVNVQCLDRPNLLFDIVCTLTDMEYVVFHGTIDTDGDLARQELYIRHNDGSPISSEAERQRVIQCLQAAIERRATEGQRLEICMEDRPGLLSEVTRTFRENGLLVTRAEVSTKGHMASNVFYVTDVAGQPADLKAIDAVRQRVGFDCLVVKEEQRPHFRRKAADDDDRKQAQGGGGIGLFSLGNLFRRNLYNLGLIKSCS